MFDDEAKVAEERRAAREKREQEEFNQTLGRMVADKDRRTVINLASALVQDISCSEVIIIYRICDDKINSRFNCNKLIVEVTPKLFAGK